MYIYISMTTSISDDSLGWLDMGGASTQISFVPASAPVQDGLNFTANGQTYHVYSVTFLGYGQDQSLLSYLNMLCATAVMGVPAGSNITVDVPCYLKNYTQAFTYLSYSVTLVGTSDPITCRSQAFAFLGKNDTCATPPCSILGTYQPALPAGMTFYADSAYAFLATFFFPAENANVTIDMIENSTYSYCNLALAYANPIGEGSFAYLYCWVGFYYTQLLRDGYGFPGNAFNPIFANSYGKTTLEYIIGAVVDYANQQPIVPVSTTGAAATSGTTGAAATTGTAGTTATGAAATSGTTGSAATTGTAGTTGTTATGAATTSGTTGVAATSAAAGTTGSASTTRIAGTTATTGHAPTSASATAASTTAVAGASINIPAILVPLVALIVYWL